MSLYTSTAFASHWSNQSWFSSCTTFSLQKSDRMEVQRPVNLSVTILPANERINQCDPKLNDVIMKSVNSNEVKIDEEENGKEMNQAVATEKEEGEEASTNTKNKPATTTSSTLKSASNNGKKVIQSNSSKLFESLMILPALFMASIISVV